MLEEYIVLDLETTGLSAKTDRILEIGAVFVKKGEIVREFSCLIHPHCILSERIVTLTGITQEMAETGAEAEEILPIFLEEIRGAVLVGQNLNFDYSFLKQWAVNHRIAFEATACDTLKIARELLPADRSKKLSELCAYFGIERERAHRALDDAKDTQKVFRALWDLAGVEKPEGAQALFTPRALVYQAKRQTPATKHQLERLEEYRMRHGITEPLALEGLTRNEVSRLMDRYVLKYGR